MEVIKKQKELTRRREFELAGREERWRHLEQMAEKNAAARTQPPPLPSPPVPRVPSLNLADSAGQKVAASSSGSASGAPSPGHEDRFDPAAVSPGGAAAVPPPNLRVRRKSLLPLDVAAIDAIYQHRSLDDAPTAPAHEEHPEHSPG